MLVLTRCNFWKNWKFAGLQQNQGLKFAENNEFFTWDPNAALQCRVTFAAPEGRVAAPPAAQLQGRPVVGREVHDRVLLQPCT